MIDPTIENLLTIREATKAPQFRRNGRPVHFSTVFRWMASGDLESIRVGGLHMTSSEAIARYIARQNAGAVPAVSPREREREIDSAERRLVAAGV